MCLLDEPLERATYAGFSRLNLQYIVTNWRLLQSHRLTFERWTAHGVLKGLHSNTTATSIVSGRYFGAAQSMPLFLNPWPFLGYNSDDKIDYRPFALIL